MKAVVYIIKDKINEILNTKKINFANIDWELKSKDVIDIFEYEDDIWNNIKPVYSVVLEEARYEDPQFNRMYEKLLLYKPNSDIFEEVHIAFIIHKNQVDSSISMKVEYV